MEIYLTFLHVINIVLLENKDIYFFPFQMLTSLNKSTPRILAAYDRLLGTYLFSAARFPGAAAVCGWITSLKIIIIIKKTNYLWLYACLSNKGNCLWLDTRGMAVNGTAVPCYQTRMLRVSQGGKNTQKERLCELDLIFHGIHINPNKYIMLLYFTQI